MKKIIIYHLSLWYILFTLSLYTLDDASWHLFILDTKNIFRFCSDKDYFFCVLLTLGIFILLICIITTRKLHLKLEIRIGKSYHYTLTTNTLKFFSKYGAFLCLCNIILLPIITSLFLFNQNINHHVKNTWMENITVAHAGGTIDNHTYSNCEEAILTNYEKGHRVFEIDFQLTRDNKIVGKHDWEHIVQENAVPGYIPTLDEFLSTPIYGRYTPLTFENLCKIMNTHKDIWIVTDSKYTTPEKVSQFFTLMVENATELGLESVLSRFIVQLYNEDMYATVHSIYPFDSYIFTLYQLGELNGDMNKFGRYARFCYQNDIDVIVMWYYLVTPEVLQIAHSYGISIYAHTLNDLEYTKELIHMGVSGIYTDEITPDLITNIY